MMLTVLMPFLLLPLVALAIDGTRLYIVQSKLSAAVDGAALGAGRLLGTPANTTEVAAEFLKTNFPPGYWNTTNLQYNINFTNNLGVQTISIYATTSLPAIFARILGQTGNLVSAGGTATRRVTRLMMVLDRSGSMANTDPVTGQNVFTTMRAGAEWFAAQFTPNYDEVGLIVFSSGAVVAYPETRPWDPSPSGVGGPDKTFATNPQTQTGQIFDQLNAMGVGGGTGTPEALAMAYIELQKTHNRDLAANGFDNTLNNIVLFTDGVPDSIATYANDPAHNSLKPFGANPDTQTPCTNTPAIAGTASTQMRGYIVAGGNPLGPNAGENGWGGSYGLMRLPAYDNTASLSTWLAAGATGNGLVGSGGSGSKDMTKGNPVGSMANCAYMNKAISQTNDLKDFLHIPTQDMYGYSTAGLGFTNSVLYDGTSTWQPNTASYNPAMPLTVSNTGGVWDGNGNHYALPYMIAAAAWNVTDAVGKAVRTQNIMNPITIFTIGYSGNGGTDTGLLNRLANTPTSTSFVSTEPLGKFYLVNSTAGLQAAFSQVASSILRLSQ